MSWKSDDIDTARILSNGSFDGILSLNAPEQLLFSNKTPNPDGIIVGEEPRIGSQRLMQPGRCFNFDGVNDYIACGSSLIGTGSFTISFWIYIATAGSNRWLYSTGYVAGSGGRGISSYITTSNILLTYLNDGGSAIANSLYGFIFGQWNHIAIVVDRTANTFSSFLNGAAGSSVSISSLTTTLGGNALEIGKYTTNYLLGRLFDFQIISKATTQAEINQLYTLGCNALPNQPRSLWLKCDEQHTLCATDSSGNLNHGVLTNVTATVGNFFYEGNDVPHSYQNDNNIEQVFKCDTTNYLTIANSSSMLSSIGSFSFCWRQTVESVGAYFNIFSKGTAYGEITNYLNYYIRVNLRGSASPDLLFYTGGYTTFTGPTSYALVVSYSGGTAYCTLYKNGVQIGSTQSATWTAPSGGSSVITLGSRTGSLNHSGILWDCQLYNTAITSTDVLNIHNGTTASGLISHLPLTKNEYLIDKVSGLNATPKGVANWAPVSRNESNKNYAVDGGKLGLIGRCPRNGKLINSSCLTTDGIDDYVNIVNNAALVNTTQSLTVMGWFRGTNTTAGNVERYTSGTSGWRLIRYTNYVYFSIVTSGGFTQIYDNRNFSTGSWYHVAGVYDGATMKLYINGVIANSTTKTGNIVDSNTNLTIAYGAGGTNYNNGSQADIRVYKDVLSPTQILYVATGGDLGDMPTQIPVVNYPMAEGAGTYCYDIGPNALHGTITNANLTTAWATKQNIFHYNISKGFSKYTHSTLNPIYVPYNINGIPLVITPESGYTKLLDSQSGPYYNLPESLIDLTQGVSSPGSSGLSTNFDPTSSVTNPLFKRIRTKSGSNVAYDKILRYSQAVTDPILTAAGTFTQTKAL